MSSQTFHILLVDDSAADCALVRHHLTGRLDFELSEADSLEQYVEYLSKRDWDLIITDNVMVGFSGMEAIDLARQRGLETPFILLTGQGTEEVAIEAMRRGVGDYVIKTDEQLKQLPITIEDVIDRDRRDRARAGAEAALGESEQRFRTLFNAAADSIFVIEPSGVIREVNRCACESLGYTAEQLRGMSILELALSLSSDEIDEYIQSVRPGVVVTGEGEHCRRDGTTFPVEFRLSHLESGGEALILDIARDVTTRAKNEAERDAFETELRQLQKLEAIGTLASGVAHDFSNLLTAIDGYAELAEISLDEGHPVRRHINAIRQAAAQAGEVGSSLLTYARLATSERQPLEFCSFVTESFELLRNLLPASIELDIATGPFAVWANADRAQFQQVLLNLAINARDSMPDGGRLKVTVSNMPAGIESGNDSGSFTGKSRVVLRFVDTGCGMTEDVQSRAFEPFYSTKPRGQGTGLGLAVVHGIVSEHQGRISIESQPGHGTCITIRLHTCQPPKQLPTPRAPAGAAVLLVESDDYMRQIMLTALDDVGYEVMEAATADQASGMFRDRGDSTKLIVVDVDQSDGLYDQLRQSSPQVPVIATTGRPDRFTGDVGERTRILIKPFRVNALMSMVAQMTSEGNGKCQ